MRLLIDTSVFLWLVAGDYHLSAHWKAILDDDANEVFLSIASLWEIAIKDSINKLPLPYPLAEVLDRALDGTDFKLLPISIEHLRQIKHLPHHHRDPFDRLIIAQALTEGLTLVTTDGQFAKYDVPLLP